MNTIRIVVLLSIFTTLCSCYESNEDNLTDEDLDIVVTTKNANFNFSEIRTFVLPDTIISIEENNQERIKSPVELQRNIVNRVRQNLVDLGYTEETDPQNNISDLVVLIQSVETESFRPDLDLPFWGNWGWFDWPPVYDYGIGVNFFRSFPFVFNRYDTGSLIVLAFDPQVVKDGQIELQWFASLNGILGENDSNIQSRAFKGIDQAFDQSPYLGNK